MGKRRSSSGAGSVERGGGVHRDSPSLLPFFSSSSSSSSSSTSALELVFRGGGPISSHRVVFSLDGQWMYCTSGSAVRVLTAATGEVMGVLRDASIASSVVSVIPLRPLLIREMMTRKGEKSRRTHHLSDPEHMNTSEEEDGEDEDHGERTGVGEWEDEEQLQYVLVAHADGQIVLWSMDQKDSNLLPRILRIINIYRQLYCMGFSSSFPHSLFLITESREEDGVGCKSISSEKEGSKNRNPKSPRFVDERKDSSSSTRESSVGVEDSRSNNKEASSPRFCVSRFRIHSEKFCPIMLLSYWNAFEVSPNSDHVCIAIGRSLYLLNAESSSTQRMSFSRRITSVRFHPVLNHVAVGDEIGRIHVLFEIYNQAFASCKTSLLHWHAHQVSDLDFSHDGAFLFSGGSEAVLVQWELSSNKKWFFPRLGAPLYGVTTSPNDDRYAVLCSDNTLKLIDSITRSVERIVRGLRAAGISKFPSNSSQRSPIGLIADPQGRGLYLEAGPFSLELYDPKSQRHVEDFDIVARNAVSGGESRSSLPETRVSLVRFDPYGGKYMASIETYPSIDAEVRQVFKLWRWSESNRKFVLHMHVDDPHDARISDLAIASSGDACLAISVDVQGEFKVWSQNSEDSYGAWFCRSAGNVHDAIHAVDISHDGTLFALASSTSISLWDAQTNQYLCSFSHSPITDECIRLCRFIPQTPHLLVHSKSFVSIWDVSSGHRLWSCKLHVDHAAIAYSPFSSQQRHLGEFALVSNVKTKDGNASLVFIFRADSDPSVPSVCIRRVGSEISGISFDKSGVLHVLTARQEIWSLMDPNTFLSNSIRDPLNSTLDTYGGRRTNGLASLSASGSSLIGFQRAQSDELGSSSHVNDFEVAHMTSSRSILPRVSSSTIFSTSSRMISSLPHLVSEYFRLSLHPLRSGVGGSSISSPSPAPKDPVVQPRSLPKGHSSKAEIADEFDLRDSLLQFLMDDSFSLS